MFVAIAIASLAAIPAVASDFLFFETPKLTVWLRAGGPRLVAALLRNLISFYHQRLPRSGMVLSS
jgi:hypothetical protein